MMPWWVEDLIPWFLAGAVGGLIVGLVVGLTMLHRDRAATAVEKLEKIERWAREPIEPNLIPTTNVINQVKVYVLSMIEGTDDAPPVP